MKQRIVSTGGIPSFNGKEGHGKRQRTGVDFPVGLMMLAQWGDHYRRRLDPEKRLMLAVLEDAVYCYQAFAFSSGYKNRGRQLFREAREWFFGKDNFELFSFENICLEFNWDHNWVRLGLRRWLEAAKLAKQGAGHAPCDIFMTRRGRKERDGK